MVDDAIPKILVSDVTRLRQVLVNLIGNAVKFTHEGEVAIEVKPAGRGRTCSPEPGREHDTDFIRHPELWLLHFSVRDTGMGIPVEKQHRLFKSFQQVDASTTRHYGGTGLGLAICKRLVEMMGGKIWVESSAGKGATFHFTIEAKSAVLALPPAWQTLQPQLAGKRLLIVEDNATNRQIMSHRFKQWGITVETAINARDALAMLAGSPSFDAAVLDLQLPDKDGLTLAEEIRSLPRGRLVPLLLLSSVRLRGDDPRPLRADISVFVHKPIRPAQLLDALYRSLSIQLQREKKAPALPALDANCAARFPLRLLLADDNLINQKVGLSPSCRNLVIALMWRTTALKVLQALEQIPYDILLLDVQKCARWTASKPPAVSANAGRNHSARASSP